LLIISVILMQVDQPWTSWPGHKADIPGALSNVGTSWAFFPESKGAVIQASRTNFLIDLCRTLHN